MVSSKYSKTTPVPKREATFIEMKNTSVHSPNLTKVRRVANSKSDSKIPVVPCNKTPSNPRKHNCLAETPRDPKSHLKRKSISMLELPCQTKTCGPKKVVSKEHGDETKMKLTLEIYNDTSHLTTEECNIARRVFQVFMMNAWRKKRTLVGELQSKTQTLQSKVDDLNIQKVVLGNLLQAENLRVAVAYSDCSHLKSRLENEIQISSELKRELSEIKIQNLSLQQKQENMQQEIRSLNDELKIRNESLKQLHEHTTHIEKKLEISKQKESQLEDKLREAEVRQKDQTDRLMDVYERNEQFQSQITELIRKNHTLCEQKDNVLMNIKNLQNKIIEDDFEKTRLQETVESQLENIVSLRKELKISQIKIMEKDEVIATQENEIISLIEEKEQTERRSTDKQRQAVFAVLKTYASLLIPVKHEMFQESYNLRDCHKLQDSQDYYIT